MDDMGERVGPPVRDKPAQMLHTTGHGPTRGGETDTHILQCSVAYLCSEDQKAEGNIHLSFLMARSRVATRKQLSIPWLELCAALPVAQLLKLLQIELTLKVETVTLWPDSTTVLSWLKSTSCHFKVFVGTRIVKIQESYRPESLAILQLWLES